MDPDFPVTELREVVVGATGRSDKNQITVFDGVGFAMEDFSALRRVRERLAGVDFTCSSISSPTRTTRAIYTACSCAQRSLGRGPVDSFLDMAGHDALL